MAESNQSELEKYVLTLGPRQRCKYADPFGSLIVFCNCHMKCKFQSPATLRHHGLDKHECMRERFMKLSRMLTN